MARRVYHESLYRFHEAQPSYGEQSSGPRDLAAAPLAGNASCDVAIIGGVYTGLSAALHLGRDFHLDVRVLEAGHLGWGASGRNGGFCTLGGTFISPGRLIARHGIEEARRYYRAQVEAVELVRTLAADEGIELQAQGDGELTVAHSRAAYSAFAPELDAYRRALGLDAELIPQAAFREQGFDCTEQFGAMKVCPGFGLHPMRYLLGLARAAERRGAVLHPCSEVLRWHKESSTHVLATARGHVRARHVVVACNGFMPEHLHPALKARVLPVQSNIVVTRPLTESARGGTHGQPAPPRLRPSAAPHTTGKTPGYLQLFTIRHFNGASSC